MNATATIVVVVILALVWVAIAAAVAVIAARRLRLAETVLAAARTNAALLEAVPARPLLVAPDDKIEIDQQLSRDLGLKRSPARLSELTGNDSGIEPDDLQSLIADVATARVSARSLSRTVRVQGSARVFEVRGGPAPQPETPGTLLLWFYDTSAGEEDR